MLHIILICLHSQFSCKLFKFEITDFRFLVGQKYTIQQQNL